MKAQANLMTLPLLDNLRLIARIFTRPVFAQLAATGDAATTLGFLRGRGIVSPDEKPTLATVLDELWSRLFTHYRSEYVFKSLLANRIVFGLHSPRTASCLVELPVGRSIADVAVVNGTTTAYEVKTEFDSPLRLKTQSLDYLAAFDRVFVVAPESLADKYLKLVDARVGIVALTARGRFVTLRDAVSNAKNLSPQTVFRMLRRSEYLPLIESHLSRSLDLPNGLISQYCSTAFEAFSPEQAHAALVTALRARTTDVRTARFVSGLPSSLRALGFATPLSGIQQARLLETLYRPSSIAF